MKITINKFTLALIAIGSLVFGSSLFNGFVWDDEEQVLNNSLVHTITNLPSFFSGSTFNTGGVGGLGGMYYKPMMSIGFSSLYSLFGPNAFFFHLFQLILHIANANLIFVLFSPFFTAPLAFLLSLIFLVHPVNVEAVVYISALQDALYMFFGLVSLKLVRDRLKGWRSKVILGTILLSSFLSKETGLLFLPILLLYSWFFYKDKFKASLATSVLALTVYLTLRFLVAGVPLGHQGPSPILNAALDQRLLTLPKIAFFYISTFFFPKNLAIAQHWLVKTADWDNFFQPLLLTALFFTAVLGWIIFPAVRKKKIFTPTVFFFLWFAIGLSLHLQIFPLDMTVADRWFYLPMVGLLGIIGTILTAAMQRFPKSGKFLAGLGLAAAIIFSGRTIIRNSDWKDGLTLYGHDIAISKDAFDLENNYGVELFRAGNIAGAEIHFAKSTQIAPRWWTNWNNLGVIAERQNNASRAKEYYQKAIDNGGYYLAYENLANILLKEDPKKARQFCKESLAKLPLNPKLWLILTISDYKLGLKDEALFSARQAYLLSPSRETSSIYSLLASGQPLPL